MIRMTAEMIAAAVAWLGLVVLISAATALLLDAALDAGVSRPRLLTVAFVGASVAVAMAHRLNAPDPLRIEVWRRDLLIGWAIAGAAAGVAAVFTRASSRVRLGDRSTEGVADR